MKNLFIFLILILFTSCEVEKEEQRKVLHLSDSEDYMIMIENGANFYVPLTDTSFISVEDMIHQIEELTYKLEEYTKKDTTWRNM